MTALHVTNVERIGTPDERLKWTIDLPRAGEAVDGYFLTFAGWVFGPELDIAGVTVRFSDGRFLTSGSLFPRSDVSRHLQLAENAPTAFRITTNAITLPPEFDLTIEINFAGGTRPIARISGTKSRTEIPYRPSLQPFPVTSLGRTGTTVLVEMMADHPSMIAQRIYPYETRVAAWWMHALTILSGHRHESSHPDSFSDESQTFRLGFNPWSWDIQPNGPAVRDWLRKEAVEDMASFCQRQIDEWYRRIGRDQNEHGARFFVEKGVPNHVPRMFWQLYGGAREIFLFRDFRDMCCSFISFDAKRQQTDFTKDDSSPAELLSRIVADYRRLVLSWEERQEVSLMIRYEDLLRDPGRTIDRIVAYAGIESSPSIITSMTSKSESQSELASAHRTTETWSRSIGRYRNDMTPELRARALELGADLLEKLGYEL